MPKEIDPELKARAVRLVNDHRGEHDSLTAAAEAVARQRGVGKESVRRWVLQADIDSGDRHGVTSEDQAEIKALKAKVRRLEEDNAILKGASVLFLENSPPQPLIMGFIDTMRAEGHAVESICRVLREQGCQIAARTYRAWRRPVVAARTITDAHVVDSIRSIAWTTRPDADGVLVRKLAPEGLYGRRKMTAYLRRVAMLGASWGRWTGRCGPLGCVACVVTKGCGPRSPPRTPSGPGTCSTGTSPPAPRIGCGSSTSPVPTWSWMAFTAFVTDVFSRRIMGWRTATWMPTELPLDALEMALWTRQRAGRPTTRACSAGWSTVPTLAQYTAIRYTERISDMGAVASIGTVGDSYDNAMAESVIGL